MSLLGGWSARLDALPSIAAPSICGSKAGDETVFKAQAGSRPKAKDRSSAYYSQWNHPPRNGAEGARGERPFEHFGGCFALGVDLVREADGGHGPDSHLIPFAVDHFFDQHELAFGLGFEFADLAVEETVEFVGRFAGDEDCVGEESVADVALAAFGFSFFGGGAVGAGAVGSGGGYLGFRALFWFRCGVWVGGVHTRLDCRTGVCKRRVSGRVGGFG